MGDRRDAAMAAFHFASALDQAFSEVAGASAVWTFGSLKLVPGAASIIPGGATLGVQFRDPEEAVLDAMEEHLAREVSRAQTRGPCQVCLTGHRSAVRARQMDPNLQ